MRITKTLLLLLSSFCLGGNVFSQVTGTFTVQGDATKFYPVTFYDGGNASNVATTLEIGRSYVHKVYGDWWGSIIAKFRYHTTDWGNGSNFIDADIREKYGNPNIALVAGWTDVTYENSDYKIVIWLRGQTPYYYKADYGVTPAVYDGVANALPYQETGGAAHTFKSAPESYVNHYGMTYQSPVYFNDPGTNYFGGSIGIGTRTPGTSKLAVEGTIAARKIKVTQSATWPDFVFDAAYQLPSLQEVESYIAANKHLPDVPSAADIIKDGQDLGEMNRILLKKVEELTLYMIEMKKENEEQKARVNQLMEFIDKQQKVSKRD